MVAHAPHARSSAGFSSVVEWWARLKRIVRERPNPEQLCCLADADATVGSVQSEYVGPVGAEPENDTGALFHECLRHAEQVAAS
eukprot:6319246-Pyramimonas_sp.AAC.1